MHDAASWLGTVGQWFAGLITLFAVLVALFKDDYVRRRDRPILKATIRPGFPDCAPAVIYTTYQGNLAQADSYYIRLWVENIGKDRAEDVQVYVANLYRRDTTTGSFRRVERFLPMNLSWAHSQPKEREIFAKGVASKMGRHCDVGHLVKPQDGEPFGVAHTDAVMGVCSLMLDLEAPPATGTHMLAAGTYRLELWIAGSNAQRITKFVQIKVDGRWFDDIAQMFTKGLVVEAYR
jgi:hypothetical protein